VALITKSTPLLHLELLRLQVVVEKSNTLLLLAGVVVGRRAALAVLVDFARELDFL
jgi:hypothetical protein